MRILFLFFMLALTGCASIYSDRLTKWKAKQFDSDRNAYLLIGWVPVDKSSTFDPMSSVEDNNAESQCLQAVTHNKVQRVKMSNVGPAVARCMQERGWELKELGEIRGEF